MDISKRAKNIQASPIRKLAAIANKIKERGIQVYHLNIGQPDISTPSVFYQNIRDFSDKVLSYGPSDGLEDLKSAMRDYFFGYGIQVDNEDIVITTGGSEAVSFAFQCIADHGDEIIIPEPFYTNYNGFAAMSGLKIVPLTTLPETGYHLPDVGEIEKKITTRTRGILICSPNNPTGTVLNRGEIEKLADIARKHDIFLLADEVYREFTYDGEKHFSILELEDMDNRVIVLDSISKRYSACGARVGAVISRNRKITQAILKFAQARLCPPTLEQIGAIAAYRMPGNYFEGIIREYQYRRDIMVDKLISHPDVVLKKPSGAFYIMAKLPVDNSDNFARWMLEDFEVNGETVMVAPGAGFYSTPGKGVHEVRIAYVLETKKLETAGDILLKAIEVYNTQQVKSA